MARVPCAFSVQDDLLKLIDERAASLGMKRSEYIVQVLRQDLINGKPNLNIVAHHEGVGGIALAAKKISNSAAMPDRRKGKK